MRWILVFMILLLAGSAGAELIEMPIDYRDGDTNLRGYLTYDVSTNVIRPGIIVCHEWWGMNDYAMRRARQLAEMGFIVLACDIYGDGKVAESAEEASALAKPFYEDRELMRSRVKAAMKTLRNHTLCDKDRIAMIGYCFGGTCALELARSGADIRGAVSFHGGLNTPNPEDAKNIKGKVLVLHGADDPYVPPEEVAAFQDEMRDANVDWQMISYGNAVHAFTNSDRGTDNSKGAAYNADADRRSWSAMIEFLREIFKRDRSRLVEPKTNDKQSK